MYVFPDGVAVRSEYHAAPDFRVFDKFGFFDVVGIPLGEIVVHRGYLFYEFVSFVCHFFTSFSVDIYGIIYMIT